MALTNRELKFYFHRDTAYATDYIDLLTTPFQIEDNGLDISQPSKTDRISNNLPYSPMFSEGPQYEPREVTVNLMIMDFDSEITQALYRRIEQINYLSEFVSHPLASLEVHYGDDGGAVYKGFLRVISAELGGGTDIFSMAKSYNQSVLGHNVVLKFKCEPFFYKHNPITFEPSAITDLTIGYTTDVGTKLEAENAPINHNGTFMPIFRIDGSDIEGDVPTPAIIQITHAHAAADMAGIYVGMNHNILYPNYPSEELILYWNEHIDSDGTDLRFTSGEYLPYNLAGRVFVILEYTSVTAEKVVNLSIKHENDDNARVDRIVYPLKDLAGETSGSRVIGTMNIPYPGRRAADNYNLAVSVTGDGGGSYSFIFLPAWQLRGYITRGRGLATGEKLIDNPFDSSVFVRSAAGSANSNEDGSWYAPVGAPIMLVPGVNSSGGIFCHEWDGANLLTTWEQEFNIRIKYNPRYLYLRNIS